MHKPHPYGTERQPSGSSASCKSDFSKNSWALAKAAIDWDSSLGYADVAGFRLGVCHPIPLFDPVRMQPMGIEEHPLIVMDCTLTRPDYMSLTPAAAQDYVHHLLRVTRRHHGQFVLLLHNTTLGSSLDNGGWAPYSQLLQAAIGGR